MIAERAEMLDFVTVALGWQTHKNPTFIDASMSSAMISSRRLPKSRKEIEGTVVILRMALSEDRWEVVIGRRVQVCRMAC